MLTPLIAFEQGMERARYLSELYELLENQRVRKIYANWASNGRPVVYWYRLYPSM